MVGAQRQRRGRHPLALGKGGEVRKKGRAERGWVGGDGGEDGGVVLEDGARVAGGQVQGRVAGLRKQNTRGCTGGPRKIKTGASVNVQRHETLLAVQSHPPLPFVAHLVFGNRISAGRHHVFRHLPMPAQRRQVKRGAAVLRARAREALRRGKKVHIRLTRGGKGVNNGKGNTSRNGNSDMLYMRPKGANNPFSRMVRTPRRHLQQNLLS